MATHKILRLFCAAAIMALVASSCGGSETVTIDGDASDGDTSNETADAPAEPVATISQIEPTAIPAPTTAPEPTVEVAADAEADDDPTANAQSADEPAEDDGASVEIGDRGEAVAVLMEEGFAERDAICVAEGAYSVFGTWDFIDLDPDPAQAEDLDLLLDTCVTTIPGPATGSPPPGENPELDALWVACDAGDASSCDNLYFDSPLDTDYEQFGFTCGGRSLVDSCDDILGGGNTDGDSSNGSVEGPTAGSPPPGEDAELDALWVACAGGSADACDDLFWQAPLDSNYEAFGLSCGGRTNDTLCGDLLDN